jgi:signal transduction histidine kinase
MRVSDDGAGLQAATEKGAGIGLQNTRRRLEQMYGNDFSFVLRDAPGGGTEVIISIPLRN